MFAHSFGQDFRITKIYRIPAPLVNLENQVNLVNANRLLQIKKFNEILRALRPRQLLTEVSTLLYKRQFVYPGSYAPPRKVRLSMHFAFIKFAMLSFPLVLAAVAGGAHTPTNLTYWRKRV